MKKRILDRILDVLAMALVLTVVPVGFVLLVYLVVSR